MADRSGNPMRDVAPGLADYTENVLFGDVWERPGLSPRDRSLITVATLVALYRTNELPFHLNRALDNGVSREELAELITHLAFYLRVAHGGDGRSHRPARVRRAGGSRPRDDESAAARTTPAG